MAGLSYENRNWAQRVPTREISVLGGTDGLFGTSAIGKLVPINLGRSQSSLGLQWEMGEAWDGGKHDSTILSLVMTLQSFPFFSS